MSQSMTSAELLVQHALNIGALELVPEGRKLKSGRVSPYFFNSGLFTTGHDLAVLARAYADTIRGMHSQPHVLFGPAYKGIPLVASVATLLGNSVEYAFNRKEEKGHGEGGLIVGASLKGKTVLIIDDVITKGTTKKEALEIITAAGGIPFGLIVGFDRQERGEGELSAAQEFTRDYGLPVWAAAALIDLISVLQSTPPESGDDEPGEILEKILAYQAEYGV